MSGLVPAIVYGKGKESIPLAVRQREFERLLDAGIMGRLVDLVIPTDGNGGAAARKTALVKEVQRDVIRGEVIHVDFQEVSLTEHITTTVPIHLVGEERRKNDGGILQHVLWEVEVSALPLAIPERFEVDLSGKGIGDSVRVGDLPLPEGVRMLTPAEEVVVTIVPPQREEAVEAKPAEGAAAPEGQAATAAGGASGAGGAGKERDKDREGGGDRS